jgi:hypothetical protein
LLGAKRLSPDEAAEQLARALAHGSAPADAAHWFEGFLYGSGQVLVSSARLFGVVDAWLTNLPGGYFEELLPLLRRTTSTFSPAERRQIGERVRAGGHATGSPAADDDLDPQRAALVEPVVLRILGLKA